MIARLIIAAAAGSLALLIHSAPASPPTSATIVDESPFVRGPLANGEHESLLYVWTRDVDQRENDFLAVVDVAAGSRTFGEIVGTVTAGSPNNEPHHMGYNADATRIFAAGMFSNRIFIYEVGEDPRQPRLIRTVDLAPTGFTGPHSVFAVPEGVMIAMLGNAHGSGPAGLVLLNDDGDFVESYPRGGESAPTYMYDMGVKLGMNRMVTSSFAHPEHAATHVPEPHEVGNEVIVWDWEAKKVLQVVELDAAPLGVRWLHAPEARGGFINAAFGNSLWYWSDDDGDGQLRFERVLTFPDNSVPIDLRISPDDRSLYLSLWGAGKVQRYDISNPRTPELRAEADVQQPNMLKLSPDGQRLYVTNSLLRTMDGEIDFGAFLFQVGDGGLRPENGFAPDFKGLPGGLAGPHDMLLR
jgi:methanethiol oxidase